LAARSARIAPAMSLWTDEEIRGLISLWPVAPNRRSPAPLALGGLPHGRAAAPGRRAAIRRGKAFRGDAAAGTRQADRSPHDAGKAAAGRRQAQHAAVHHPRTRRNTVSLAARRRRKGRQRVLRRRGGIGSALLRASLGAGAWEPWVSLSDGRLLWVLIGKWVSGGVPHTPLEKHQ